LKARNPHQKTALTKNKLFDSWRTEKNVKRLGREANERKEGKEKKLSRPSVQKIKNVAKSWDVFDERKKLKEKLTLLQQQLL